MTSDCLKQTVALNLIINEDLLLTYRYAQFIFISCCKYDYLKVFFQLVEFHAVDKVVM